MQSMTSQIDRQPSKEVYSAHSGEIAESWAFIYVRPCRGSALDRIVVERHGVRTTLLGVPNQRAAVQAAVELVEGGV